MIDLRRVKLALVGFGVIGKGVAKVLAQKRDALRGMGIDARLVAICEYNGSLIDANGIDPLAAVQHSLDKRMDKPQQWKQGATALSVIPESDADIVIEVTPTSVETGEPGTSHMLAALNAGKHLVTSNKGPLALNFWKLVEAAEKSGAQFRYEATVCGGMPVFNLVRKCLPPNGIESIQGILNGTTNFILTKMHSDNLPFEIALQEAKERGIAEANPKYDVEAIDPAAKLVILANAVMGMRKRFSDVRRMGIDKITPEAVQLARRNGFSIKLIGEIANGSIEVVPRLVPVVHPLNVSDTLNALLFKTDLAREVLVVGRGAGQMETASAIISDVIDVCNATAGA